MNGSHIVLIPRISEKSFGLSKQRTYVFTVPTTANIHQIATAVEGQYGVTVTKVNTLVSKGKKKKAYSKRSSTPVIGFRKDTKKAYVTLTEGDSIKMFEEGEA